MLGQRDDAERDRHPRLDPRRRILLVRIALDPDQFGRAAADVEQDRAPPLGVEQRRAADHGKRRLGLAVDHLEPDAGLGGDAGPKAVGIGGRAAGLGCDQPQAFGLAVADLVAADAERRDGAVDRRLADGTGRGNAFAQPDDPRKRIHHAKTVAGRTGDQKPAIIGAKVERGIDTVSPWPPQPTLTGLRGPQGLRAAAYPHSSKLSFRGPHTGPPKKITVHGNFSSAKGLRNNPSHRTMPNQALSGGDAVRYLSRNPRNRAENPSISGVFRCKITRRRPPWKTLSHCKNTVSGSRCAARKTTRWSAARANTPTISRLPGQAYCWMVRSSHAHGIIKGYRHGRRQGDAGRARRLDRQGSAKPPATTPSPAACR